MMIFISLCSLSYEFIVQDCSEVIYPMQAQMTRKTEGEATRWPLTSTVTCSALAWCCTWTLQVLNSLLPCTPLHQVGCEHHLQTQYVIPFSFMFTPFYYVSPTTPFPKPKLEKNKFYINKQIWKKLFEINNVGLGLYVSAQFLTSL